MNLPFSFETQYGPSAYYELARAQTFLYGKRQKKFILSASCLAAISAGVSLLRSGIGMSFIICAAMALWLPYLNKTFYKKNAKKMIQATAGNYPYVSYEFMKNGFYSSVNGHRQHVSYKGIQQICQTEQFVFLFFSECRAHIIDKRGLETECLEAIFETLEGATQLPLIKI